MRPPRVFRLSLLLVLVAGIMAAAWTPSAARSQVKGSTAERAAASLRDDPVYVEPGVADFDESDANALRRQIEASGAEPIYIAVLPDNARRESRGSAGALLGSIVESMGRPGTYAVVVGTELRAGATGGTSFEPGQVPALADQAVAAHSGEGTAALLLAFVARLRSAAEAGGNGGGGSPGFGFFPLLLLVGGGLWLLASVRRRRRLAVEEQAQLQEVKRVALDDMVALGEDLRALDLDVEMPGAEPKAKDDYVRALNCYRRASGALDQAARLADLQPVTSALEEGRHAMACAKARLEGRELPERRPPCFFDPRHGPSVRDVEWSPEGGALRKVPACAEDARRLEEGLEPRAREVMVEGQMTPYWNAPFYYGPWIGGYYGAWGAAFLPGILMGSMLGSGMGWGLGDWGAEDGGDSGDFGGGDFGGGDFGGGDFGGGDFGGGDFGGGDFGGGS